MGKIGTNLDFKGALGFREFIVFAREPHVQGGEQENADDEVGEETTNNNNCEGPLGIGADGVRKSGGQQSEGGNEHGHHDGPEAQDCALYRCLLNCVSDSTQLIDELDHDDAGLHRDTKQSEKSDS